MAFLFRLEMKDGAAAEPPTLTSAVPNWSSGDTIPLGAGRDAASSRHSRRRRRPASRPGRRGHGRMSRLRGVVSDAVVGRIQARY